MGFNYFSPIDVSEKIPLDPKIHFNGGYSSNDTNIDNTNNFTEKLSDYQKMLANGTASSGAGSPELDETFMAFYKDYITSIAFNHLFSFTTCLSMFWFSMLWISLTTRQLLWFYMYMCTLACLPISYFVNNYSIELIRKSSPMIELEESKSGPISIFDYLSKKICLSFSVVPTYSSLSNTRVGFNKSVLDGNFTKNINVLPFYLKYFPVLVLQKHVLING